MRQENPKELGTWPFEIGLWVGSGGDAELHGQAGRRVRDGLEGPRLQAGQARPPARPAGEMPLVRREVRARLLHAPPRPDNAEELRISCLGDECDFTGDRPLPIHMVDEPIYHRLPGFLIATVDKFAAMPWKGEVGQALRPGQELRRGIGFFGDCDDRRGSTLDDRPAPARAGHPGRAAPDLRTAGHDRRPLRDRDRQPLPATGRDVRPKIVVSTATVRRAERADPGAVRPALGADLPAAGPTAATRSSPGPSRPERARRGCTWASPPRAERRSACCCKTYLALMSAAADALPATAAGRRAANNPADPYMTLLGYFNSLRELGGTRRLVEDEVTSRLDQYGKRQRLGETRVAVRRPARSARGPGADLALQHRQGRRGQGRAEPPVPRARAASTSPSPRT